MAILSVNETDCPRCHQRMMSAGCAQGVYFAPDGDALAPISVDTPPHCRDCNAAWGFFHHGGCAAEKCPRCGSKIVACGCQLRWVPTRG